MGAQYNFKRKLYQISVRELLIISPQAFAPTLMVARLEWAKDDRSKEFSLSIISDTQDIVLIGVSDIHEVGREVRR